MKDTNVFGDKDLSHLLKDVFDQSERKRGILYDVITQLRGMMTDLDSVIMVGPVLKEYLDVLTRSDEHLLKIATIVQRIVSADAYQKGGGDISDLLSQEDRQSLLNQAIAELDNFETKLVSLPATTPVSGSSSA